MKCNFSFICCISSRISIMIVIYFPKSSVFTNIKSYVYFAITMENLTVDR